MFTYLRKNWLERLLLLFILASGIFLRAWDLGFPPFWEDEAESSINALTILQHGYPGDHYLGIPLYENTLIRPWPESREYEFKDLSYSDRGMAVYHGWLPLYSIAASFSFFAIHPDEPHNQLQIQRRPEEFTRRTVAARIPSIVFAMITMLLLFVAGRALYGKDAAWAALVAGAFLDAMVWMGRQARYYSAALALSLACGFMLWWMLQRGRWRDFFIGGIVFTLLFHTNLLSFINLAVLFGVLSPLMLTHRRAIAKLSLFVLLIGVGVIPWMLWTGFLEQTGFIPRAWPLLSCPDDLFSYLGEHKAYAVLYGGGLLWLLSSQFLRQRQPERLRADLLVHQRAVVLLCAWITIAVFAFFFLTPAASFFFTRLSLLLLPPCLLLAAILLASLTRAYNLRPSVFVTPALFLLFLFAAGRVGHIAEVRQAAVGRSDLRALVEYLRRVDFQPGTKFYATPNDHLPLTFYTGLPFQSIAAVRKEFLDAYEGDIVFMELVCCSIEEADPLSWRGLQQAAIAAGQPFTESEAQRWSAQLSTRIAREEAAEQVARVHPPLEALPPFIAQAVHRQRALLAPRREMIAHMRVRSPMYRGYNISTPSDWWQTFFYRFVNPETRRGPHVNYRERLRRAEAFAIPATPWVLYSSPPRRPGVDGKHTAYAWQGVQ